jgi:hypothetical protein
MATITAVELGPDTCALARTSVRGGVVHLLAAEMLEPAAFPGAEAFATALTKARRARRLPRRCRVVVWGLPEGANRENVEVKPLLAPLVSAGFKVERVVSPCNALAALARLKSSRGEGSMCWLAVNRGGVAIVVVRPGSQIYAHSFVWDSSIGNTGSQARLLQRYSLVSFLSPEIKRAMAEARKAGSPVNVVVTCGNLPDLRSLTMPLIEELDVEVEPLDSLEGLAVKPEAADKLAAFAPAIRLACAAAIARGSRPWDPARRRSGGRAYLRTAALAAVLAIVGLGLAYQWYMMPRSAAPLASAAPAVSVPPQTSRVEGRGSKAGQPGNDPRSSVPDPRSSVPDGRPPAPKPNPPAVSVPPQTSRIEGRGSKAGQPGNDPRSSVTDPRSSAPDPRAPAPKPNPPAVSARPPAVKAPARVVPPASRPSSTGLNTPVPSADKPEAGSVARTAAPVKAEVAHVLPPAPLRDAIPRVTAILVSRERRYATIDGGQIVGIGDLLGRRTVVGLDERSMLLQEPSGVQIRVGLGGRLLAVDRTAR